LILQSDDDDEENGERKLSRFRNLDDAEDDIKLSGIADNADR
jgi:hypothetical protein